MKLLLTCGVGAAACGTGGFTDLPGGLAFDLPHSGRRSIHVWIGP